MSVKQPPAFLTVEDVARALRISRERVEELVDCGQLIATKIPATSKRASLRFSRASFEATVASWETGVPELPAPKASRKRSAEAKEFFPGV